MSSPNIANVSYIYCKTIGAALTTSSANLLINAEASNKVYKISSIYVANVDGTNAATVTLGFYDASASATYKIASTVSIPSNSTLDVISKSIYLEEGDKITGLASASSDLEVIISYEEIS